MGFYGEQPERWLVRVLVTRDPAAEGTPDTWDYEALFGGGDPVLLSTELVGYEVREEDA